MYCGVTQMTGVTTRLTMLAVCHAPASGPPGTLVQITGTGLEDILDVGIGSGWIAAGHWAATAGAFVGSIPSDATVGVQSLIARGKGCDPDLESSFEVTAQ